MALNIYKNPEIANKYSATLKKRAGLCLFDEYYLEKNISQNTKVLDLGCGTGRHLIKFGNITDITGVDISPRMIEIANKALDKNNISAKTIVGDILNIDKFFKDVRFDTILMMYHTFGSIVPYNNRVLLLKKIKSILKKDGNLIFHVHNRNHLKNLKFLLDTYWNNKFEIGDKLVTDGELKGAVIHFFSKRELERILDLAGFKIAELINLELPNEKKQINNFKKLFNTGGFIIKACQKKL